MKPHARKPPRDSRDGVPPLPIDLARILEAERTLEEDLTEIQEKIWRRIQERMRAKPQDADLDSRPAASVTPMADLIDLIAQEDRGYIARQIASFGVLPADVEDITPEVLLGVVRSSSLYDTSRGKLRTWLHRVAFYRSRSFLARAYHHREELEATPVHESSGALGSMRRGGPNPEEQVIINEERRLVWDVIEKIEIHRRAVFIGYEIMEMGMEEIAQALGIPASTAWGQLQKARKEFAITLRRYLLRQAFPSARRRR